MHYLICYDIVDDKIRNRIYRLLCDVGDPVQYSAIIVEADKSFIQRLMNTISEHIESDDHVRCYPMCRRCTDITHHMGISPIDTFDPDYFWCD